MRFTPPEAAMLRQIDERATMERLEREYDMEDAPKGALATFMNEALVENWDQDTFEEALDLYKEDLKHKEIVTRLAAEFNVHSPAQYVEKFSEDFIQHYCDNVHEDRKVAELMLTFRHGGSDWTDMEGYSRYGVGILAMFHIVCEEKEDEEEDEEDEEEEPPKKKRVTTPENIQISLSPEVYLQFCQFCQETGKPLPA